MCGIVGVIGEINLKEKKAFKDLLRIDVLRGPHSTGVAFTTPGNNTSITKKALLPDDLFSLKGFEENLRRTNLSLIGHNRYATQGAVNGVNAHPFEFEKVVGVHNGTLRGQWRLPDNRDYEVDSENIYHAINKNGVDETVKLLEGAYTLVWWDTEDECLRMVRNSERPMFYCFTENRKQVFYASESWMLVAALNRNGIKHGKIVELPIHTLTTFKSPMKGVFGKTDFVEVSIRAVEPFRKPTVVYSQNNSTYSGNQKPKKEKDQGAGNAGSRPVLDPRIITSVCEVYPIEVVESESTWDYIRCVMLEDSETEVRIPITQNSHLLRYVGTGKFSISTKISGGNANGGSPFYYGASHKAFAAALTEKEKASLAGKLMKSDQLTA